MNIRGNAGLLAIKTTRAMALDFGPSLGGVCRETALPRITRITARMNSDFFGGGTATRPERVVPPVLIRVNRLVNPLNP